MAYRVFIAEERRTVRGYLKAVLEACSRYSIAGLTGSADAVSEYCAKHQPDLVILGISARRSEVLLDRAAALKREYPGLRLILVTDLPARSWLKRVQDLGADGFAFLEDEPNLLSVVERVMAGERVFPPEAPSVAIGAAQSRDFSDRELEVLQELLTGDGNIEIADRLGIRPDTVKFHLKSMMQKTGFATRTALAVQVQAAGLTTVAAEPEKTAGKPAGPTRTGDV